MSAWSGAGNVTLGELVERLKKHDPNQKVERGFGEGDSHRGYYEDLAFEPVGGVTVGEMLDAARFCIGKTYEGYKGGKFRMDDETHCWIASYGECGDPITPLVLDLILGPAEEGK